jgi:hypothetical protein
MCTRVPLARGRSEAVSEILVDDAQLPQLDERGSVLIRRDVRILREDVVRNVEGCLDGHLEPSFGGRLHHLVAHEGIPALRTDVT